MNIRSALARYFSDVRQTRTQTYLFIIALWNLIVGIQGTLTLPTAFSFGVGCHMASSTVQAFGGIPLTGNGWHGLLHLLPAVAGFVTIRKSKRAALLYGLITGTLFLVVSALGFWGGDNVLGIIAVDTSGNFVHLADGLAALLPVAIALTAKHQLAGEPSASLHPAQA
ncbi:DUF4383 domain-containing protein [Mycobacteroides abscessus]|uniref:DUF4383 domain-containing protein n=1 Tax=Mycobacteroides abscessus TaxID=36809 RepID=UPI0021037BA5|nr:DUF4383 domain-containing protein [Mycobacteroides abscessus]